MNELSEQLNDYIEKLPKRAGCMKRIVRLSNGKRFTNPKGGWVEISWQCGNLVCYNQSGSCYWQGGRLQCTKTKFRKMLTDGNYLPNAIGETRADNATPNQNQTL
jgi:hypothetical protein